MPNVIEMKARMQSHLARVSGKSLEKELARIWRLEGQRKISYATARYMVSTAAIRLAWIANAA